MGALLPLSNNRSLLQNQFGLFVHINFTQFSLNGVRRENDTSLGVLVVVAAFGPHPDVHTVI